jgi:phage I-like protein
MKLSRRVALVMPGAGEKQPDFMKRCIPAMMDEGKENAQAVAMCSAFWEKRLSDSVDIRLQEAKATSDWQMILPMGSFQTRRYGQLDLSETFLQEIVKNWKARVLGERQPFIDTDHDWGKSNGWIVDLRVQADGLYAKIDWTDLGRENVGKGYYKYFSADIEATLDTTTGEEHYPVLVATALTNTPQMHMMPPARLSSKRRFGGAGSGRYPAGSGGGGGAKGTGSQEPSAVAKASSAARAAQNTGGMDSIEQITDASGDFDSEGNLNGEFDANVKSPESGSDIAPKITDQDATEYLKKEIERGEGIFDPITSMKDVESLTAKVKKTTSNFVRVEYKIVPVSSIKQQAKAGEFSDKSHKARMPKHGKRRKALGKEGTMDKVKELLEQLKALKLKDEDKAAAVLLLSETQELSDEQREEVAVALKTDEPADDEPADDEPADDEPADDEPADETPSKGKGAKLSEVRQLQSDVKTLKEVNLSLSKQLKTLVNKDVKSREDKAIALALEKGRILPKDEKAWRKKFNANPDLVEEILDELPIAIDLSTKGHGGAGLELTEEDITAARVAKMSIEDYKKLRLAGKL